MAAHFSFFLCPACLNSCHKVARERKRESVCMRMCVHAYVCVCVHVCICVCVCVRVFILAFLPIPPRLLATKRCVGPRRNCCRVAHTSRRLAAARPRETCTASPCSCRRYGRRRRLGSAGCRHEALRCQHGHAVVHIPCMHARASYACVLSRCNWHRTGPLPLLCGRVRQFIPVFPGAVGCLAPATLR